MVRETSELYRGAILTLMSSAGVCSRMLTYANVCSRMLTYADVCCAMLNRMSSAGVGDSGIKGKYLKLLTHAFVDASPTVRCTYVSAYY